MRNRVIERTQERLTRQIVRAMPTEVALVRPAALVSDGAGGVRSVGEPVTLPTRWRAFIPTSLPERLTISVEGQAVVVDAVLIGARGDDIRPRDEFEVRGVSYKVATVDQHDHHQVKAYCVRRGDLGGQGS